MTSTARRPRQCSVCHAPGHDRRTCLSTGYEGASNVVHMRDVRRGTSGFHTQSHIGDAPPNVRRVTIKDVRPELLSAIHDHLRSGYMERWADFVDVMLLTDPHLAGVYETRISGSATADWDIDPGDDSEHGALAAELFREAMERMPSWVGFLEDMLHANGVGVALAELVWSLGSPPRSLQTGQRVWYPSPETVQTRDLRFLPDWALEVRSYAGDGSSGYQWRRLPWREEQEQKEGDLDPAGFVVHFGKRTGAPPNLSGDLLPCSEYWLFKHWAEIFFQSANERAGMPGYYAKVPRDTTPEVRDAVTQVMANFRHNFSGVLDQDVEIHRLESAGSDLAAQNAVFNRYNAEITKALLGSIDATDAGGDGGGSRARAETQSGVTIVPRMVKDADALASSLNRQLVRPFLRYNLALFGGRMPPLPRLVPRVRLEERAEIPEHFLSAGMRVRINELRAASGLEPLSQEEGGEAFAVPPAKERIGGGTSPTVPFPQSRQGSLPLTTLPRSGTSSARSASARYGRSAIRGALSRPQVRRQPTT